MTPDARLEDPELFICIFKGGRKIDLARYVTGIFTGFLHSLKDVIYRQCREVIIEGSAHIQTDGTYFGKSPVKISAVNNALNLIF